MTNIHCEECRLNFPSAGEFETAEGAKLLCATCRRDYENCNICGVLTTRHTPRGICPACMDKVYQECEYILGEYGSWARAIGPDEGLTKQAIRRLNSAVYDIQQWLLRQRARSRGITVAQLLREEIEKVQKGLQNEA